MKARLFFYAIALAFVIWTLLVLLLDPGSSADPGPTGPTTTDPPADTAAQLQAQLDEAQRKLQAANVARARDRRRFRRRLAYVIHTPPVGESWLERAFMCVHAGEGAWTDNTGNGYQGGLQMDAGFQATYGGWALRAFGTADRWPVSVQVATGIRAWAAGRGFAPWPNTARACGLLR